MLLLIFHQLSSPFVPLSAATELVSTLGGPECRLGLAGEAGNERRFLADPFSGVVVPFSSPNGLGNLDLAFADCVITM